MITSSRTSRASPPAARLAFDKVGAASHHVDDHHDRDHVVRHHASFVEEAAGGDTLVGSLPLAVKGRVEFAPPAPGKMSLCKVTLIRHAARDQRPPRCGVLYRDPAPKWKRAPRRA